MTSNREHVRPALRVVQQHPLKTALCALLLSGAACAQQDETRIELSIDDGARQHDTVIRIDGSKHGFSLRDMQRGETQALTTEDGRPVTVTRNEEGYLFDIDGEQVQMPAFGEGGVRKLERHGMHAGGHEHIVHKLHVGHDLDEDGVTIISGKPLDAATRASVEASLAAAGMVDVRFLDGGEFAEDRKMSRDDEERQIRVIRKEVHVTN